MSTVDELATDVAGAVGAVIARQVDADTAFADLHMDSLDYAEINVSLSEAYAVRLPEGAVREAGCVRELVRMIRAQVEARA
ncbi:acyl carrier protein [Streptomyces sp. NPDC051555]|uniref:acyl carrier protein n=1 Tax=Streptomyces sp. NPDC051555 TaxID=3365657 RepID=UPI003792B4E8